MVLLLGTPALECSPRVVPQEDRVQALDASDSLRRMLYGLEIERVRYLISSYLRCRIEKIQQQSLYLDHNEEARAHLSATEVAFAEKYTRMYQNHVRREAWEHQDAANLPETIKDITRMELLATPPKLEAHVFCIAMDDCPPITIDTGGAVDAVELVRGDVALLPYGPLRPLLEAGKVLLT